MSLDMGEERACFEMWISAPPFEMPTERFGTGDLVAWPGQYKHEAVQLAWEAWQQALRGEEEK